MRRLIPLLLPGCVVLEIHEGNGVPATDTREVPTFNEIVSASAVDVELIPGDGGTAVVSCDENLVDHIETAVEDEILTIQVLQDKAHPVEIIPNTRCVVSVAADDIAGLRSSGSGNLTVTGADRALGGLEVSGSGDLLIEEGLAVAELKVLSGGSGDLVIGSVSADLVVLINAGSGSIQIGQGGASELSVVGSGSGDLTLRGLAAGIVDVVLSGSGDAEVTALQALSATLSGSGDLTVWGNPGERDVVVTGSGEVHDGE